MNFVFSSDLPISPHVLPPIVSLFWSSPVSLPQSDPLSLSPSLPRSLYADWAKVRNAWFASSIHMHSHGSHISRSPYSLTHFVHLFRTSRWLSVLFKLLFEPFQAPGTIGYPPSLLPGSDAAHRLATSPIPLPLLFITLHPLALIF